MAEPFWKQLIKQDKLEAQYEVLLKRGTFTDKEIAIHLARFAEAHIFNAADRRIDELERTHGGTTLKRHERILIIASIVIAALSVFLFVSALAQLPDTTITLPPGGAIVVTCPNTIGGAQVDARTLRISCPNAVPTVTPTRTPTPTPIPTSTVTPLPTNTPVHAMQGQWHAPGAHDGLNPHSHGESPQQWVTDWSVREFGHGVVYGGDENSGPMEMAMKEQAYKGVRAVSDAGGSVYLRYHAASNPLDRSARYHSYEVYYRDTAGNVSFWQGWYDSGDPNTDARCPRRVPALACEDQRPIILVVDQTSINQGVASEQWYLGASPQSGVSWDMGITIIGATTLYKPGENTNAADQSTWTLTGDKGMRVRSDGFWYRGRGGGGTTVTGWFCAENLGRIVSGGSKTCPAGSLPQYIASTLAADARPDGFGNVRIGWLVQRQYSGIGVTVPN